MALIAIADRSFVVITPDIPGLRAVQGAMEAMADAGVLGEQTSYLLNEPHAHGAIEQADIERHLTRADRTARATRRRELHARGQRGQADQCCSRRARRRVLRCAGWPR
jgi:hypothetical protein